MNNINQSVSSVAGGFKVGDRVRVNIECSTGKITKLEDWSGQNGKITRVATVKLPGKHPQNFSIAMLRYPEHE